ncbi:MAG: hypothetical protein KC443_00845 [Anaerolineales bacterium]|nr:hypothetical protein [Anaerolineales bacterium]
MTRRNWTAFLLICFVLVGCMRDEATAVSTPTPTPESSRQTTGAMARPNTATPSPSPTALPTTTPSPTPILPQLRVADQVLHEDGVLTIEQVNSPAAAWLVVRSTEAETGVDVLGYTAVPIGSSTDLAVTIDPLQATDTLVAELYTDAGTTGELEIPDTDEPLLVNGTPVAQSFAITIEFARPTLTVADQVIAEDGIVLVESVYTAVPGWLAIHADEAGEAGEVLGHTYINAGLHENVAISIPWREAPPYLLAVLYADEGEAQRFDYPDGDAPQLVNNAPVAASFHVTFPPDVFVLDQPVVNGEIVVERVVSNGPGWVVIHYEDNDELGLIIGFAPLVDGVNEQVHVPIVETAVTDPLYIMLHQDTGDIGEFNFPREDPQVTYNDIVMTPIPFGINPGNILYTQDQPLVIEDDTVTVSVPLVIVDIDTWVVIYADAAGSPGDILGQTWVAAGIHHDVQITVAADAVTDTLHVILHHDADSDQNFDYPDGADNPLQRNRHIIQAPFDLLTP